MPAQQPRNSLAWRALAGFWAVVGVVLAVSAGALQVMGPPKPAAEAKIASIAAAPAVAPVAHDPAPVAPSAHEPAQQVLAPLLAHSPPAVVEPVLSPAAPEAVVAREPIPAARGRAAGEIAPPDPGLMESSKLYAGGRLPRIGADRRRPMQTYAAAFNAADTRPRIAILIAGIGMNEAESATAISNLPAAVSLAVTPYAVRLEALLDAARLRGHETLVSIPMEPQGFPLNDPGNQSLLTGATQATNALKLEWALTRFQGYVGATGALGSLRGERFAAATDQMIPVLDTLADRGLLYIDPRPDVLRAASAPTQRGTMRSVDLVLDDPAGAVELDRRLARLEQVARDRGSAMGLAGRPSPVTVDRIAAWAIGLSARGLALAPVSTVVQMPQAAPPSVRVNLLR